VNRLFISILIQLDLVLLYINRRIIVIVIICSNSTAKFVYIICLYFVHEISYCYLLSVTLECNRDI
jgi:hypothetical protein